MGVMKCNRKGCENILCELYSSRFGYICRDCYNEMKCSHMPIAVFMSVAKNDLPNYNYDEEFKEG